MAKKTFFSLMSGNITASLVSVAGTDVQPWNIVQIADISQSSATTRITVSDGESAGYPLSAPAGKGVNKMLIEFNGYADKPIFVEKSKIAGICTPSDLSAEFTTIFVCAGECTEEWKVREPIDIVRNKIDYEP